MKLNIFLLILLLIFKFSFAETADQLIELALKNNPQLKKIEKELKVLESKVHVADRFPNPSFSLSFSDGGKITVRQYLPWYDKLKINKHIEEKNYEAQIYAYKLEKNKIVSQIKENAYYVWLYKEKIKTLNGLENLLKDIINRTRDEDRLKILLSNIILEKINYHSNLNKKIQELKTIVNSEFSDVDIDLNENKDFSIDEAISKVEAASPLIKKLENKLERDRLSYKLSREIYYPDVTLSIDYKAKEDIKNAFSMGVGLNVYLPFWRTISQEQSVLAQKLFVISQQEQKLELLNNLKYILSINYEDYLSAKERLGILKDFTINYENSLKKAINEYAQNVSNFQNFYIIFNEYKNYKMSILEQVLNAYLSIARMEELTSD
ncbi:TolC family protein [Sulfurihydrogenibium sp.]|jgi:outer membrane protein TolC|uniref:TolC family protein n=1 Tax=Sulfurihydrogenibium sp. TaxID=2053621 RepID=UPI002621D50E|nr:TolC family protein [Sulfurihydrogenibium sp.]